MNWKCVIKVAVSELLSFECIWYLIIACLLKLCSICKIVGSLETIKCILRFTALFTNKENGPFCYILLHCVDFYDIGDFQSHITHMYIKTYSHIIFQSQSCYID